MPYQSVTEFVKKQDGFWGGFAYELDPPSDVSRIRPCWCPYCNQGDEPLRVHGYRMRYGKDGEGKVFVARVVRFQCPSCRRTITVLPPQLHAHRIFTGEAVRGILERMIRAGHTVHDKVFSRSEQRFLLKAWEKVEAVSYTVKAAVAKRLALLASRPGFCILEHPKYRPARAGMGSGSNRADKGHHPFCLDVWSVVP